MTLQSAHRGYEYQDLLSAARLVDIMLGTVSEANVDEKLVPDDRFDDLTIVDSLGQRERVQFKHTDNDDRPLTLKTFTEDRRGLRLDHLLACAVADRNGPGATASFLTFRVVMRDARPQDDALLGALRPANPDPGPFLSGMKTLRMRFDPEVLWPSSQPTATGIGQDESAFAFLQAPSVDSPNQSRASRADLVWLCERLIVEVEAPAATADLTTPGAAELILLDRAKGDIGAGLYPNVQRSPLDVAEALIRTTRSARQGRLKVTANELMRRSQLRQDFGAVAKIHPVDPAVEVQRSVTIGALTDAARAAADQGAPLLIVGPPGQGKSWVCQQLIEHLKEADWLVAEHYCYLGDADEERLARVYAESLFGSLLGRLADLDPTLVDDQRPRFAASREALEDAVRHAVQRDPDRPVALVVDGVDHASRVQPAFRNADPSRRLADELATLDLPRNTVLIVLGQAGEHLQPLHDADATVMPVPALSRTELELLASRLGVVPAPGEATEATVRTPLVLDAGADEFVDALIDRSAGNALYATYLCREALRRPETVLDPAATLRALPPFDGALKGYYEHLYRSLGSDGAWVADLLALLDFAVTRKELCEIRPDIAHRVDDALGVLGPVLVERAAQGGLRVYHESFARFLRTPFQQNPAALTAVLDRVVVWLQAKGFLEDERAYRFLIPTLASAGRDREVLDLVDHTFLARSVAAGYPASAVIANLLAAIGCATRADDWPAIVRCIELSRGAATYEYERFDSALAAFVDVPMAVLGADVFASRLLFDGRPVASGRAGLLLCAAVDANGAVAPWQEYMTAYLREHEKDNVSYGSESEQAVGVAWMRGRLRLSATSELVDVKPEAPEFGSSSGDVAGVGEGRAEQAVPAFRDAVNLSRLAEHIEENALPVAAVVDALADTRGITAAGRLVNHFRTPGGLALAVAERLAASDDPGDMSLAREWAVDAVNHGLPAGVAHRLLRLDVAVDTLDPRSAADAREALLALTRQVQERSVRWETGVVDEWLDACAVAVRQDPLGLTTAEASLTGAGWYRCWLRFVIALVRAETAPPSERPGLAANAIHLLTGDLNPFAGDPRACDLYAIHGPIDDTLRRAVAIVDDNTWPEALEALETVSDAISTTLFGELGGPLPADRLLALAIDATTTEDRRQATLALIERVIAQDGANRYYVDLAEYRLFAARFALQCGELDTATRWWIEACQMLTAYGWHKDVTIYELLDPLPTLIRVDPARGRACVARVQPLCERIPYHTDGKETRHAWAVWWELVAQADPSALARLAGPALMTRCNLPYPLLHDARHELWRSWHDHADPEIAGLLRLSLDTALDPADPEALSRLADATTAPNQLLTLLLARADERPVTYSVTNSSDLLGRDDRRIEAINAIARRAGAPRIAPITAARDGNGSRTTPTGSASNAGHATPAQAIAAGMTSQPFSAGLPGIASAAREWRRKPYDAKGAEWSTDRFANIIGYRLIELVNQGHGDDAETSLRMVAGGLGLGDQAELLAAIADGVERHGHATLAAFAHTLAWTRTRGGGGWRHFGGETRIDSLRRAVALDSATAMSVLADEVQQTVAGSRGGTFGVTQALIHAFATLDALAAVGPPPDTAFACWDEAAAVIASRAPRVHANDDPDQPYAAPDRDPGTEILGDLDAAFAIATLAGVAAPERESKRRALLAAQLLIHERPDLAAVAFDVLLPALDDPGTLAWLLRMLEQAGDIAKPSIQASTGTLERLAVGPHLTVRTLARRLLSNMEAASLPALPGASPDEVLLRGAIPSLWTPTANSPGTNDDDLYELIDEFAGPRLADAETILAGLRNAVHARVARAVDGKEYQTRMRAQLDTLADRRGGVVPDAYLANEEATEDAIQTAAGCGRASFLASGHPIHEPAVWEDRLADALLDDPAMPLAIEATRHPRPALPAPPTFGDPAWSALRAHIEHGQQPPGFAVISAAEHRGVLSGTLAIAEANAAGAIVGGRFGGWRIVATIEKRRYIPSDHRMPILKANRYCAIEVRRLGDEQMLDAPPFAKEYRGMWSAPVTAIGMPLPTSSQPLISIDAVDDGQFGLGGPGALLTPTPTLVSALNLHPCEPRLLHDDRGSALALVTWRTEYDRSDYHQALPRLRGAAILMRPDLHAQLTTRFAGTLVLRDFVVGGADLAGPAAQSADHATDVRAITE